MEIIYFVPKKIKGVSFAIWADNHNLKIHVHERDVKSFNYPISRYYANFDKLVEIAESPIFISPTGNSDSLLGAISELANRINNKTIIIQSGKELKVPKFTSYGIDTACITEVEEYKYSRIDQW